LLSFFRILPPLATSNPIVRRTVEMNKDCVLPKQVTEIIGALFKRCRENNDVLFSLSMEMLLGFLFQLTKS
jgi:hypothetical protein